MTIQITVNNKTNEQIEIQETDTADKCVGILYFLNGKVVFGPQKAIQTLVETGMTEPEASRYVAELKSMYIYNEGVLY